MRVLNEACDGDDTVPESRQEFVGVATETGTKDMYGIPALSRGDDQRTLDEGISHGDGGTGDAEGRGTPYIIVLPVCLLSARMPLRLSHRPAFAKATAGKPAQGVPLYRAPGPGVPGTDQRGGHSRTLDGATSHDR